MPDATQPEQLDKQSWRGLYRFESHFLKLPQGAYHYVDQGAGEPVLMVHGNPTWSFYWRNLVSSLQDSYRAIAVDHIGCGLSARPDGMRPRLADHIENLVTLVTELDLHDITLVAHDWGGAIGLGAALRLPDRFARFVLLNTAAFPPPYIPFRIRVCRWPVVGKIGLQGFNLFTRAALSMTTVRPGVLTPQIKAGYLAPYNSWTNRSATYTFVKDIPLSPRHPTYQTLAEIEAGLPALADRPFQFNWGMQDWCFRPECLDRFLELVPGADVHRFENAGHWVMEDAQAEVIANVQQFLSQQALPREEASR